MSVVWVNALTLMVRFWWGCLDEVYIDKCKHVWYNKGID